MLVSLPRSPAAAGNSIAPEDGASRPAMIWSRVDLPQPEGPSRMRNSPAVTSSVIASSAGTRSPVRAMCQTLPTSRRASSTRRSSSGLFEEGEIDHPVHRHLLLHPAHLVEPGLEGGQVLHPWPAGRIEIDRQGGLDGLDGQLEVLGQDARDLGVLEPALLIVELEPLHVGLHERA